MLYYSTKLLIIMCSLAALTGACMGSFINCLAWRITRKESILKGRSHCDSCGHPLGFLDLIPIFSYIFSGGRCRYCKERLSYTHLLAELLTAVCYTAVLLRFDLSLKTVEGAVLSTVLIAITLTDIYDRIIPDGFLIFGITVRFIFILLDENKIHQLLQALIGSFAVAGVILILVLIFEKVKKTEAMGGGDIKLIFMTGIYLGWQGNILCVLLASLIGIVFGLVTLRGKEDGFSSPIPWGPSIALSCGLCYLFGDALIEAYLKLF